MELKFRVWDKVNNEYLIFKENAPIGWRMPNGNYEKVFINAYCDKDMIACSELNFCIGSDNFIVEQYTGLKDKKGNEIYCGDIVECYIHGRDYEKYVVEYDKYKFILKGFNCSKFDNPYDAFSEDAEFEVIGNIHENTELLKWMNLEDNKV